MKRRSFIKLLPAPLLINCGGESPVSPVPLPTPDPGPTPSPTPTFKPLVFPLGRSGGSFVDRTGPVRLWGGIPLDKSRGWPLINSRGIDELAEAGINWTHIRLGPHGSNGPDADTTPTGDFWSKVEGALNYALLRGVAVEIDVIDGWVLKHDYNYFGWDRNIVRSRPTAAQIDWVNEVVQHTQGFNNVMYQISNESNLIGATPEWELPIRDMLKVSGKLVGTNSALTSIEQRVDYVNRHQDHAIGPIQGKPTMVNETGPDLTPEDWEREVKRAIQYKTSFHLWRGDMSDAQWADALRRNAKLREVYG